MNEYLGSEVYEKAHGFGLKTEEEFSHSGWWKNGRPNGFGLRIYSDNTVDIGVWEDQTLIQTAIIYPKGLQYLMDKKFGQLEAFAHAKVNCQKMILNCDLDEPVYSDASSSKKAFFLDDEKQEIERIESSLTKRARKRQQNFDSSQDQHILNLPQDSVHFSFWNEVRTLEKTNEEAFEALSILKSHQQGPCIKKIFAALTLIASKNYQELYQLLRQGLNPNSRDLLGYSLLHASVLANSGRTIQTLLTAGAISQSCLDFTPLHLAVFLHYQPRLAHLIKFLPAQKTGAEKLESNRHDSETDSAYGSHETSRIMSSRQLSKRPRSSVQSTPRRLNRPRSTPSRFSLVRERPCRASESFKNIIKLLLRVGICEKQSCVDIPPLLFFPVLAKDEEITREMLLSGADTSDCFLHDGILLEAITLSPETTADITAMLVYSRAIASRPAQTSSKINKKVELFLSQKITRECSSALFRCAKGGHLAQCVSLIQTGSDINEEFGGNSVLGVAILNGHFELVAELIRLGADCSSAQSSGGNPVGLVLHPATDHLFTITQKIELVNLLVDSGAKIYSKCKLRQKSTSLINTVDFIDKAFHPKYGKPPLRGGFFSELSQDEKRNYLARGEFQSYLLSILKEQLTELAHAKDPKALSACFECGTANKKLVPDSHFKVIAFCGSKCRKLFWRSNPSRTKIISRKRRVFNFEPFFLQSNLIDNYSYN